MEMHENSDFVRESVGMTGRQAGRSLDGVKAGKDEGRDDKSKCSRTLHLSLVGLSHLASGQVGGDHLRSRGIPPFGPMNI